MSSKLKKIPGSAWAKNSCWINSSYQVLAAVESQDVGFATQMLVEAETALSNENAGFAVFPPNDMLWLKESSRQNLQHQGYSRKESLKKPLSRKDQPNETITVDYGTDDSKSVAAESDSVEEFLQDSVDARDKKTFNAPTISPTPSSMRSLPPSPAPFNYQFGERGDGNYHLVPQAATHLQTDLSLMLIRSLNVSNVPLAYRDSPALQFLRRNRVTVVSYNGGFSLEMQSQFINWLYVNILGIKNTAPRWIVDGTLQDALMLWVEHQDKAEFEGEKDCPNESIQRASYVRERAWERLQKSTPTRDSTRHTKAPVDVDRESLAALEQKMFDMSETAGHAGNSQWGLDVGIHQDDWSPYRHVLFMGVDCTRDDEEELKRGPQFKRDTYTTKYRTAKKLRDNEEERKQREKRPTAKPRTRSSTQKGDK
ncbi:hypothetical protein V5O48_009138 [Marasmius crinis-equi]|uniref:Uncharacterized protein n=1 Tax=Marasmius crinis-equi TaxID=585013 RepID=A0ABR3FCM3_9AGAR